MSKAQNDPNEDNDGGDSDFFPTFCWQKNEGNNSYTTTKNSSPLKGAVVWIRSLSKPAAISSFRKMFPMEEALFPAMRQGKLKWIDCLWLWYGLTDVALRPFYSQAGFSFRNNLVQIWAMVFHSIHVQTKAFPKTHCHKKIWVRIGLFPLPFVSYTEMRKFTHPFHFPISFSLSLSSSLCIVNSWVGRKASSKKNNFQWTSNRCDIYQLHEIEKKRTRNARESLKFPQMFAFSYGKLLSTHCTMQTCTQNACIHADKEKESERGTCL